MVDGVTQGSGDSICAAIDDDDVLLGVALRHYFFGVIGDRRSDKGSLWQQPFNSGDDRVCLMILQLVHPGLTELFGQRIDILTCYLSFERQIDEPVFETTIVLAEC